jgi:hypothetical protein
MANRLHVFRTESFEDLKARSSSDAPGENYENVDERRGYSISRKRLGLAFALEGVVVVASLIGAWLFAKKYGHDFDTRLMMMLAPVAYAVTELSRVPLAVSTRIQPSIQMRLLAFVAVIFAAGVTTKSMSQLGEIMFRPRLMDVAYAHSELDQARNAQAQIEKRIADADDEVERSKSAYDGSVARATAASNDLRNIPGSKCFAEVQQRAYGTYRSTKCIADPRTGVLSTNVRAADSALGEASKKLEAAKRDRAALDPKEAYRRVETATLKYRDAILNSQLHSFTAMFFGTDATRVSDEQINVFLRIFVFVPAILVSLSSTFLAMTAVTRLKRPAPIEVPDEGLLHLLTPMHDEIVREAASKVAADVNDQFGRSLGATGSRKADPKLTSPPVEAA